MKRGYFALLLFVAVITCLATVGASQTFRELLPPSCRMNEPCNIPPVADQVQPKPTPAPEKAPALSPLEKAQVDIIGLKQQLALAAAQLQVCQGNAAPAAYQGAMATIEATEKATVRKDFEQAHPGWTLDDKMQPVKKGG